MSRTRPLRAEVRLIQRFDDSFTELWERLGAEVRRRRPPRRRVPELEVRDRAARPLHDRGAAARRAQTAGYAVYRHVHEPRGRVTLLVDFLADPDDEDGVATLLHWIDREARQADSDKIRAFAMHAGFRKVLRRVGLLPGEVHDGVRRQDQRRRRRRRRSTRTPIAGTSRSATRIRTDDAPSCQSRRRACTMHLLVGIDTEGDNQWDAAARANQTFENIYALPRLHALFARHGVRPTYVITHPVASDPRSAEVLRGARRPAATARSARTITPGKRRRARADDVARHPYASTLPLRQFEAQLDVADRRHRARRRRAAGVVPLRPVRLLRRARPGARAARVPGRIERRAALLRGAQGRARTSSRRRSRPTSCYDSATKPGTSGVLEVPVSAALNRALPKRLQYLYARAPRNYTTKRVLRKLGVARMRWLRPSYSSLDDMIGLARDLAAAGEPVLNLLFHSSEAIVGGSPYNRTQAELDAFCDRLERFLAFATRDLGRGAVTFAEFERAILPGPRPTPPRCRSSTSRRTCRPTRRRMRCCRFSWASGRTRRGDTVEYVAHPPRAGGTRRLPRPGVLDPAPKRSALAADAAPRIDRRRAARIRRTLEPAIARADVVHVHSNGLLPEIGALLAHRPASRSC